MNSDVPARALPQRGFGALLIGKEEEALVLQVLRSKTLFRYANQSPAEHGTMCATLEKEMREFLGMKFALAVTSGTAALETALMALGVGAGDEVIIPAWSWVSCFTAVVRVGARPVLAEIDDTLCLAPGELKRLRTPQTKAVIVVHYQGVSADMTSLLREARECGLRVIEDCAESPGASHLGARVGSIGDIGIFSFQFQKTVTAGEGGMVVTNDPVLYERAVRAHDLGLYRPHHEKIFTPSQPQFSGGQFRMNEMTGAVALGQFRKLDKIRSICRAIQARIMSQIGDLKHLEFRRIPDPEGDSGIEIYFCLSTPELARAFTQFLSERNVPMLRMTGTSAHYGREYCQKGLTHAAQTPLFGDDSPIPPRGYRAADFPRTEDRINRLVALPLGILYSEEDADYIAATVRTAHQLLFGS